MLKKSLVMFFGIFLIFGIMLGSSFVLAESGSSNGDDNSGSGSSDDSSDSDDNSGSNSDSDKDESEEDDSSSNNNEEKDNDSENDESENKTENEEGDEKEDEIKIRNRIKQEFNAADGSRIRVERRIEIENGKTVVRIEKKIINADGTETVIRIRIVTEEKNGKIKKIIKVKKRVGEGEIEVETELEIEDDIDGNESDIRVKLKSGEKRLLKILPEEASDIAREKLKSQEFKLELRERIHNNVPKVVYLIKTNKNGRFLGIFKLKMKIEGEIDSETGEFLGISKPWWAFLVSGEDSDQTEETPDAVIVNETEKDNA